MTKVIKATRLNKSGAKVVDLGASLADAFHSRNAAVKTARDDLLSKLGNVEAHWITLLRAKAAEHAGMTAKDYDANVHPSVITRLEALGYKMAKAEASKVKVAFLAFCHGVEVKPEHASNFQNFVNKQARAELGSLGVINHKPKGPAGQTKVTKKAAPGPVDLFAHLFKGDKVAKAWRVEALRAIVSRDPQGKLFDSMLGDMLDTLEIEIEA